MTSLHRLMPIGIVTTLTLVILIAINDAPAYELITHAQISEAAFDLALEQRLNLRQYFEDVGLEATDIFDPDKDRHHPEFSAAESAGFATYDNDGTPKGWLAAGSIREDDLVKRLLAGLMGCPKVTNPESSLDRLLNHFFRIQTDGGGLPSLLVPPGAVSYPAPDWALGRQGHGTGPNQNRFSLLDARIYQLRSLTWETKADRQRNTAVLFRSLGHVVHVLQDMAQPQHVRNDPHPPCTRLQRVGSGKSWYEQYIEDRAQNVTLRFRDVVPIPVTGYDPVEQPTYRDFWVSAGRSGLADVASRNFLTAGTNFGNSCKGLSEPRCDPNNRDEYGRDVLPDYTVTTASGTLVGDITFITRDFVDPISGATFPSVRVSTRSVWDEHLQRIGRQRYTLNTFNYDAMADLLIPRAVGYSAGLLDFFFRGRLDVDLINDATDPSLVRLSGVNLSPDPLANGVLLLFTDDAFGQRKPVTAVDSAVISADPGRPVVSGRFQPSAAAERFFAVYTGSLGAETPTQDSPGAVIGKAIGGTRVEHLFSDGNRWNVRTPDGSFPLPILTTDIQDLVWGDDDNSLVGRTAIGPTAPNQFVLYRIDRRAGDPVMPLTQNGDVRLENANPPRVGFPVNLPIGSMSVTQTMQFKQYLPVALHDVMDPNAETWEFDANLAVNEERQTTRTRDLRLDFNTFQSSSSDGHSWRIGNIYGDSNGEIFALITSTLRLRNEFQTFPTKKLVDVCGGWPCPTIDGSTAFIPVTLPTSGLRSTFAVLINVTRGEVRSLTAPSSGGIAQIRLSHVTSHIAFGNLASSLDLPSFTVREVVRRQDVDGAPTFVQFDDTTFGCSDTVPHFDLGGVPVVVGTLGADVPLYTANLAGATGPSRPPAVQSNVRKICIDAFHTRAPGAPVPMMTFPLDRFTFTSDRIEGILRARADGNRWAVLITKTSAGVSMQHVIRWDPDGPSASLRAAIPDSSADLISTSTRRATVATDSQLIVVPLEGDASVVSSPADFASASGYIALEPSFIYRPSDGRFYRISPALQQTALPRPLASSGPLSGSYHTLKLR